jgi:hypothetical protein
MARANSAPWDRNRRTFSILLVLLAVILSSSTFSFAQAHPTESQVKAAYLYNFGKFVSRTSDHPAKPDSMAICVIGKDPFGSILDSTVAGKKIEERPITVRRISRIQDAAQCSILFVGSSEAGRLGGILVAAQRFGVLTVSDLPHFAERGGVIEFVAQKDKIRFEVNRAAARQSHLALSSELLKVAVRVIDRTVPQTQPQTQP